MSVLSILKGILNIQKKLDVTKLPSQGLFYKDDFEIFIKKAELEDIIDYEYNYDKESLALIISKLKTIVLKNTTVSTGYTFDDIKAIDIIFIFLEIVKFTNGRPVTINYHNNHTGKEEPISFEPSTFNYCDLAEDKTNYYDATSKDFNFDGWRYSIPSIGVENSLTSFLIHKAETDKSSKYDNYSYDFLYFLGHKSSLDFTEIENLIHIFNFDIDPKDKHKISTIVKKLSVIGRYSLKKDSQIIDVNSKIDLSQIWK